MSDSGVFMVAMATALGTWAVTGAVGCSDWASEADANCLVLLAIFIIIMQGLSWTTLISLALESCPGRVGALATSAIVGLTASTTYALAFHGNWGNNYQFTFCWLSGVFAGLLSEAVFGVFRRVESMITASAAPPSSVKLD